MITLGAPGSPTAAVIMAGLFIWGLQPGPRLFIEKVDFVWGLIASLYVANFLALGHLHALRSAAGGHDARPLRDPDPLHRRD